MNDKIVWVSECDRCGKETECFNLFRGNPFSEFLFCPECIKYEQ